MKKLSKFFIVLALIVNQLLMPVTAWAQTVTDVPTNFPTDIPTPAPSETTAPVAITTPEVTTTLAPIPTTVLETTPTEILSPTASPTAVELTPTPTEVMSIQPANQSPATIVVVIDNKADVSNNSNANSNSGNNTISSAPGTNQSPSPTPTPVSVISTGNAVALANIVNVVNTNNVDSKIKIFLVNNANGQVAPIDLNSAWNLLGSNPGINMLTVDTSGNNIVSINNYGSIANNVTAVATSGGNQILGGNGTITTGDAYALANVFNLLNLNAFNSQLFFGVININGSSLGDLILPNPSGFSSNLGGGLAANLNNNANVNSNVNALSLTGNNSINGEGNNTILTGGAIAWAQNLTMTNVNLVGSNNYILNINTLGNWSGNIYNWESPGSVSSGGLSNLFMINGNGNESEINGEGTSIDNTAMISNFVLASAMTGGNNIEGSGVINTGTAFAGAQATNLANLNLWNSKWFFGVINVVGDWNGNAIFAYPDLQIKLSVDKEKVHLGDEIEVGVDYANVGYDDSNQAKLSVGLPAGLEYEGDNSGLSFSKSGNNLNWQISNVPAKSSGKFFVKAKVINEQAYLPWVKIAMAEETSRAIMIDGSIGTEKTEVSLDNNSAQTEAYIVTGTTNDNGNNDLWPKINIEAKNNVNNFIFPGDVVTFEVLGKNEGEAPIYDSYLINQIFDNKGNLINENKIQIGTIAVSKNGKVTFGIPMNIDLVGSAMFKSRSQIIGHRESGDEVKSNVAETNFKIIGKNMQKTNLVAEVKAAENIDQGVLGAATGKTMLDILPYILLFMLSTFWLLKQTKKWLSKK